ncbi:Heat-labile enterotoxin, A chain [Metarhizium album ARSEF 1941]|uniref:Heat-labile enterotoxin, A chain n=1 Tax=Metarhizium album (strain ARSEF 1941) TaxID=1081103 RepID=A0A0B2X6S2_METAS|nr:Heat-labile enterotoxin, A chain [Metarhizium album ARSEF 1941]KHO00991.1 Heat-labile enterotoxin, A chain [Metarhizium album ARSEF 1941]
MSYATIMLNLLGPTQPGWIYEIQPTPNMIDMDSSDLNLPHPGENEGEFSAMGGIRWDQVRAYMYCPLNLTFGPDMVGNWRVFHDAAPFLEKYPDQSFTPNPQYNAAYDAFKPSPGQPQLAGSDMTYWGVGSDSYQGKSLEQWAILFMNDYGEPVGWTGSFPLKLTAPVSLPSKKPVCSPSRGVRPNLA